jgi:hypothetical protein
MTAKAVFIRQLFENIGFPLVDDDMMTTFFHVLDVLQA